MNYLASSEYSAYGLDPAIDDAWIAAASSLINAHCRRPTLAVQQCVERMRLTPDRNTVQLSFLPLSLTAPDGSATATALVAARGRYAMPRRGESHVAPLAFPGAPFGTLNELAFDVAQAFGLPGTWTTLDVTTFDFDPATGEVTFPWCVLGIAYNEVEITYNAGLAIIPDAVKFACAQLVRNAQATPALNLRAASLQNMTLDYFADALFDQSVIALLEPFVARRVG